MYKFYFSTLLSLMCFSAIAQISGSLIDEQQQAIPFANVILYTSADSTFIRGVTTDEAGQFVIDHLAPGAYYLQISSIGFRSIQSLSVILPEAGAADLGKIILENEATRLNEVVVTARKDIVQPTDFGKVVHVQSSLMTKGSNALQVLERLAGVVSDRQNQEFSLNGQAGLSVQINGRKLMLSPAEIMSMLENTLADNIEKVELITSPSSRNDADGGAGTINIIMRQNTEEKSRIGFSLMGGYGFGEKASASVNYQKNLKKLSFIGSYAYLRDVSRSGYAGFGTSSKPAILGGKSTDEFSTFSRLFKNGHNLNITTEYTPGQSFTLGTDWIISYTHSPNISNNHVSWDTEEFDYLAMKALSVGNSRSANLIGSVFLEKSWMKSQLSLDLSMMCYFSDNPALIATEYFDENGEPRPSPSEIFTTGNRGQSLSNIHAYIAKMDYSRSFSTSVTAEFGGKISFSDNTNDSFIESLVQENWQTDPRSQSLIMGKEKILAAYSQLNMRLGEKYRLNTGLRYEFWQRDINTETLPYRISALFPTFLLIRTSQAAHSFNLGYSRRITRPLYTDLVSNLFYNDPTFIFSGNPSLKPSLTDQIKVDYNTPWLNSSLSFQYEKDPILRHQITTNQEQSIGISSPQNLDFARSLTLFLNAPFQLSKLWNMSISSTTSLRRYQLSYTPQTVAKTYVYQSFNYSHNFTLPRDFEVEVSGWHNLRSFSGSNRTDGFGVVNLSVAKKLKGEQGTISLSLPDLFRTFKVHTYNGAVAALAFDIQTESNWWNETALYQVFRLSYSRSFGGSVSQNNRNLEEELKRISH